MKKVIFCIACLLMLSLAVFSQSNYRVTWGDEIKLKKGTADLDIVMADKSGLYFTEQRIKVNSYVIFATAKPAVKLYKVDNNFSEIFDKEYKRELKGLEFHSFQTLGDDLYMFATDYTKKDRLFTVFGSKVDKNTGDLLGDFIELGHYELESKKDDYEMKMTPIKNGSEFLMVSNISNKDRVTLAISVLDKNFKKKESTVINLSFNPGLYTLQDVKLTANNKIVLLGREYEEVLVGKKKKRKRLVFKNYAMDVHDVDGKRLHGIPMQTGDRFIINGKLVDQPGGGLMLAGFYSNAASKSDLSGFFINKVDVDNGTLVTSSYKEINSSMFGKAYADEGDEDDETREEKKQARKAKDDDEEDELPNEYIIRSVDINPVDNSIIITSEVSQHTSYSYMTSQYNSATRSYTYTTTYVNRFTNQDILVINADKDGNIRWLNDIPKSQVEEVRSSGNGANLYSYYRDYFADSGGMPYYSSYKSLLHNNNLIILMNDHTSNNVNPQYGDKVKSVYNFRKKSNTYGVAIDLATGKMTRKFISSNNDETILMPRHAFVVKNDLFMPSWRIRFMAKTQLKFAKLTVK